MYVSGTTSSAQIVHDSNESGRQSHPGCCGFIGETRTCTLWEELGSEGTEEQGKKREEPLTGLQKQDTRGHAGLVGESWNHARPATSMGANQRGWRGGL